jgi:hypothetical protein
MNNLLKWGLGLAALGVTVYVAGRAWKKSQEKKGGMAGFAGATGISGMRGNIPKKGAQCLCGGIRQDCPCKSNN